MTATSPINTQTSQSAPKTSLSPAAKWHADRRREMIRRHRDQILPLESSRSLPITLPLLIFTNLSLASLSIVSASLPIYQVVLLAFVLGSTLSLWQLQILHEVLHGSMLGAGTKLHRNWHRFILFWGSIPSAFGYWLYLRHGHLSHHRSVGSHSLNDAFAGEGMNLADGDVLFVNHRMNMVGEAGPKISVPGRDDPITLSIGRFGFRFWKRGSYVRNAVVFATSFLVERVMLICNDVVVAITGRNFFFPNKPNEFHSQCAAYTRAAVLVRAALCFVSVPGIATFSWHPLLFLMLSEVLWSLPPHPACAMFVTNHGSISGENGCEPSGSTYAGKWYSAYTLGTNYHVEHHDFPTMPLHKLGELRKIAGEDFYRMGEDDDLGEVMKKAFGYPDFYACSNAAEIGVVARSGEELVGDEKVVRDVRSGD